MCQYRTQKSNNNKIQKLYNEKNNIETFTYFLNIKIVFLYNK